MKNIDLQGVGFSNMNDTYENTKTFHSHVYLHFFFSLYLSFCLSRCLIHNLSLSLSLKLLLVKKPVVIESKKLKIFSLENFAQSHTAFGGSPLYSNSKQIQNELLLAS